MSVNAANPTPSATVITIQPTRTEAFDLAGVLGTIFGLQAKKDLNGECGEVHIVCCLN